MGYHFQLHQEANKGSKTTDHSFGNHCPLACSSRGSRGSSIWSPVPVQTAWDTGGKSSSRLAHSLASMHWHKRSVWLCLLHHSTSKSPCRIKAHEEKNQHIISWNLQSWCAPDASPDFAFFWGAFYTGVPWCLDAIIWRPVCDIERLAAHSCSIHTHNNEPSCKWHLIFHTYSHYWQNDLMMNDWSDVPVVARALWSTIFQWFSVTGSIVNIDVNFHQTHVTSVGNSETHRKCTWGFGVRQQAQRGKKHIHMLSSLLMPGVSVLHSIKDGWTLTTTLWYMIEHEGAVGSSLYTTSLHDLGRSFQWFPDDKLQVQLIVRPELW